MLLLWLNLIVHQAMPLSPPVCDPFTELAPLLVLAAAAGAPIVLYPFRDAVDFAADKIINIQRKRSVEGR
jgi:hypothetical protein